MPSQMHSQSDFNGNFNPVVELNSDTYDSNIDEFT